MRKSFWLSIGFTLHCVALAIMLFGDNLAAAGLFLFAGICFQLPAVFTTPEVKVEETIMTVIDLKAAIPHMVWVFERLEEARLNLGASRLEFNQAGKGKGTRLEILADGRPVGILIVKNGEYVLHGVKAPVYDFNNPHSGIILQPEFKTKPQTADKELYRLLENNGKIN